MRAYDFLIYRPVTFYWQNDRAIGIQLDLFDFRTFLRASL